MARRPSQALETRALSASAASSRCSSGERFTDTRCFEATFPKVAVCRCTVQHFDAPSRNSGQVSSGTL